MGVAIIEILYSIEKHYFFFFFNFTDTKNMIIFV